MSHVMPSVSRVYRNWCIDSTRWSAFQPRDDDVVVATPYKSGTTWMLTIVGHLIFNDLKQHDHRSYVRWIDTPMLPLQGVLDELEAMPHRRALKTHLPLDALPFHPHLRYIYVGRDLRDVFMSLWNHHTNYQSAFLQLANDLAAEAGLPGVPEMPDEIRLFWREWITRGAFPGEPEGYPYWSALHNLSSWWPYRHLPNILFVHYNDLLESLPTEVARVGRFIGVELSRKRSAQIAELVTFEAMKRDAEVITPGAINAFKGGASTFIHKGTNGRWRDELTESDLALYRQAMRYLPDDAAAWMEHGAVSLRQPEITKRLNGRATESSALGRAEIEDTLRNEA